MLKILVKYGELIFCGTVDSNGTCAEIIFSKFTRPSLGQEGDQSAQRGGRRAERERERRVLFEMRRDLSEKFPPLMNLLMEKHGGPPKRPRSRHGWVQMRRNVFGCSTCSKWKSFFNLSTKEKKLTKGVRLPRE